MLKLHLSKSTDKKQQLTVKEKVLFKETLPAIVIK